jgi:hypothetical protein
MRRVMSGVAREAWCVEAQVCGWAALTVVSRCYEGSRTASDGPAPARFEMHRFRCRPFRRLSEHLSRSVGR